MKIKQVKIKDLKLDPENARLHPRKNIEEIKGSLEAFGQQKPIVIDKEMKVVAGNGTVVAATELQWENIDAVVTDLNEDLAHAYGLADNRTGESSTWDLPKLGQHIDYLNTIGFDFESVGFSMDEFAQSEDAKPEEVSFLANKEPDLLDIPPSIEMELRSLLEKMKPDHWQKVIAILRRAAR